MLVSSNEMLQKAWKEGYAIPSPDFVDSNSVRAYAQVAQEFNAFDFEFCGSSFGAVKH